MSDRGMRADRIELPPWTERRGVPFSLECHSCDAGMDVASMEQARLLGWQDVLYDDGPAWYYLGLCPFCAAQDAEDQGRAVGADRIRRNAERRAKRRRCQES